MRKYSSAGASSCSTAGVGKWAYSSASQSDCTNKPILHSHYTSNGYNATNCLWSCDTGYTKDGTTCKKNSCTVKTYSWHCKNNKVGCCSDQCLCQLARSESLCSGTKPTSCSNAVAACIETTCFPAGTKVLMADGTKKNIEDVNVGDIVLSYNTETNTNERSEVKQEIVHVDSTHEMYELTVNGEILKATAVHPFYVRKSISSKDYAWIEAQNLKVGDILLMSDGNLAKIEKINHYNNKETVYNIEVEGNHDYFVGRGYLVHNKKDELIIEG